MKLRNLMGAIVALAGIAVAPSAAFAKGDIMDIRCMDEPGTMVFPNRADDPTSPFICSPDRPLTIGDTLTFRVRMFTRNWERVRDGRGTVQPWTWSFVTNTSSGTAWTLPKLAIIVGSRTDGAELVDYYTGNYYSDSTFDPVILENRASGVPLKLDEFDEPDANHSYYTDFYFQYKVKAGDLGMPIRLLTDGSGGFVFQNVDQKGTGLGQWRLVDTEGNVADFCLPPDGDEPDSWPNCYSSVRKQHFRTTDLSEEGAFVKTMDFDEDYAEGNVWRKIQQGKKAEGRLSIASGLPTTESVTVYLWTENEDVAYPVPRRDQKCSPYEIAPGYTRQVLTVTLPAGASEASFDLKCADGAAIDATTTVYLSAVRRFPEAGTAAFEDTTVHRLVRIVPREDTKLSVRFAGGDSSKTVTADSDYTVSKAELTFTLDAECAEPVTVTFDAVVTGEFADLGEIYDADILRLSDSPTGDPIMQKPTTVTIPAGKTSVSKYVYVLGATSKTYSKGVYFSLTEITAGPDDVKIDPNGSTLKIQRGNPKIVDCDPAFETEPGSGRVTTTSGTAKLFKFQIEDTYRNLEDTETGYVFHFECGDGEAIEDIGLDGYDYDDGVFSVSVKFFNPGTKDVTVTVIGPDTKTSNAVTFHVTVNENKSTKIDFKGTPRLDKDGNPITDKETGAYIYDRVYQYGEGDPDALLELGLTQGYGGTGYLFLEYNGATDEENAAMSLAVTSTLFAAGVQMPQGKTEYQGAAYLSFLDNCNVTLDAVLSSKPKEVKAINGWGKGTLSFAITNKAPRVTALYAAGQPLDPESGVTTVTLPRGVRKTFRLTAFDVDADLLAEGQVGADLTKAELISDDALKVKWLFNGVDEKYTSGNPNTGDATVTYTFGEITGEDGKGTSVQVFLKDKDMLNFPVTPAYSFFVKVVDQPIVRLSCDAIGGVLNEDQRNVSSVALDLSEASSVEQKIKVTVKKGSGILKLQTNSAVVEGANEGEYLVTFGAGIRHKELVVSEMDGTEETFRNGVTFDAEVVTEGTNADGVRWTDYFLPAEPLWLRVQNVSPTIVRPSEGDESITNEHASVDVPYTISYSVDDVDADISGGIDIRIDVDGQPLGGRIPYDTLYESFKEKSCEVTFTTELSHEVVIWAKDKDDSTYQAKRVLYFLVKPSKRLSLRPGGPAEAIATQNGYSMHYRGATGRGAGRVAANADPKSILRFVQTYSLPPGSAETVYAYATGYAATDGVDNGTLSAPDVAITQDGGRGEIGSPACFDYNKWMDDTSGLRGFDSFLYAWLNNTDTTGESGSDTVPRKFNIGKSGETTIQFTESKANSSSGNNVTTYAPQYWEAVFSREYYVTDNCGDINHDLIPDIVLWTYKMGLFEEGTVAEGKDDLTDMSGYNADIYTEADSLSPLSTTDELGDFLPGSVFSPEIIEIFDLPNTWSEYGEKFDARTEIRGYGDGLNDAFVQLGITGYRPDVVYADPDTCSTSTLAKVEYLAWCEFAAAEYPEDPEACSKPEYWTRRNADGTLRWSPERPTDPTLKDTDHDGFDDGYEYYFWYRAHVGFIDANGVHRRLTGRAYDPRNPGEGRFITSEEIADAMDPRVKRGDVEQDTDNDGLPDLVEMLIGTNPFDFDSDGDGLPDGFEVIVAGTDPLSDHTAKDAKHDAVRNYDGDAMAFTTVKRESDVLPLPRFIQKYYTFATVEADGDTDGIQWYVETPLDGGVSAFTYTNGTPVAGVKITVAGVEYVTTKWTVAAELPLVGGCLAVTLDPRSTFAVTNAADAAEALGIAFDDGVEYALLRPTRIPAGTPIKGTPVETTCANATVVNLAAKDKCNAAWVYGSEKVKISGHEFGFLALGRYQLPKKGAVVAELPTKDRDVAFLHYLVYQQWGFDPRTAWSPNTPLAARWGKTLEDEALAEQVSKLGYAGTSTRTRAFTAYDEFLLYSFFLNNGCDMSGWTEADAEAPYLAKVWMAFCTNPRGTGEPEWASRDHYKGWTAERDENGCDTDGDGVPDGWELYVMAGPKIGKDGKADPKNGMFNFAPPYAAFTAAGEEVLEMPESYFSPFVAAAKDNDTDNAKYIGKKMNDSLTEYQEFVSTDACAYYDEVQAGETAAYAKTPLLPADWTWLNKFFPTDPWVPDTDDDGVADNKEGSAFSYATAEDVAKYKDDKKKTVYPGCGLNPCSVDTDMDGIPDGWENQFAGSTVSTNAVEGYIDGMDGTVADAQTSPGGPNRDYDRDGLENWQEYLTGTMRCWRYDDPFTQWGSIPFEAYYSHDEDYGIMFLPDFDALGVKGETPDELWHNFWYETLENVGGPIYNPHLVFDQSPTAQYFSRVDKGWDPNYFDAVLASDAEEDDEVSAEHHYYWFAHRIGAKKYKDAWGAVYGADGSPFGAIDPKFYVSCSPICEDSDQDGLDDYYELFHGLNPLLGGGSTPASINPCDLVWANKAKDKVGPATWNANPWTVWPFAKPRGTDPDYDFTVYPWKNGLQTADPDGDNERNYVEAIMAKFDSATGFHGDPSPMWMTDASYSNSLTRLHYRMPVRVYGAFMSTKVKDQNGDDVPGFKHDFVKTDDEGNVTTNTVKYFFRDYDAYSMNPDAPGALEGFGVDRWKVGGARVDARVTQVHYDRGQEPVGGWMFSFEENEGYDTDHDGLNDAEELAGRAHGATDPIDFDDPRRRQAMYFPGADSALQTPPQLVESHPIVGGWYDEEFPFREYTVECWVRPDEVRNATIVERAILTAGANAGDRELVRRNFQLAIRMSGDTAYWFTKFDSNGTGEQTSDEVSVLSADEVVPNVWTHLAATFDGKRLTLYVNGSPSGKTADTTDSKQQPECGVSEINIRTSLNAGKTAAGDIYKTDVYADSIGYGYHAIIVGASVRSYSDYDLPFTEQWCGYAINLYNSLGWRFYRDFFKGYVDEIRIWDGARDASEIVASMGVRFTAEMAKENRSTVYKQWSSGTSRYRKDGSGDDYADVEPELRYHFAFDSLFAADSTGALAKVPTGFANGPSAPYCRPDGYEIAWWKRILDTYGSAYAGAANYVTWIPNTVAHLPRFDGTTLDSAFWSADFAGDEPGTYRFANAAEPYSFWTQWLRGNRMGEAQSTLLRYSLANGGTNELNSLMSTFMFTGRNQLREGCDLLPLGGAYVRYCADMWDGLGAGTVHEITGNDADSDGLPDWWEKYADEQYRGDLDPSVNISWDTIITYDGMSIIAGEAYLRDLAKGTYADANGVIRIGPTAYKQTAKSDGMIPDWWKSLYKIAGEDPLGDSDNDGLNNYVEYVASELLPFKLHLNPQLSRTDTKTLDYFRKVGQLYIGEMLTDHDQMEDHWERSLGDESIASAALWDALKDGEEDGWNNFAENRYNGYSMSTLAQLVAHAMGDTEVLDAPIPSIKMKVRYNGDRPLAASTSGDNKGDASDVAPPLVVRAFSKSGQTGGYVMNPDAVWTVKPGVETAELSVYLGGWQDRVVRGTLAPGNVNYGSVDLKFAQIPQNDRYSWTDGSGLLHLARPYKEFKEALEKDPTIIQNIQNFEWLSLVPQGEDSDAVTVTRDEQSQQNAQIAVYGERVGTLDLTTGDFEFDMEALVSKMRVPYTFDSSKTVEAAWSYKEAIFKIVYKAKVPSTQLREVDFSLAKADKGFVRGGQNSIEAFYDLNGNRAWDPGEPFGVANDVEIGWAGRDVEIELTDMSAVTPRVKLWGAGGEEGGAKQTPSGGKEGETGGRAAAADSDRGTRVGTATFEAGDDARFEVTTAPAPKSRVRVVRYKVDDEDVYTIGAGAGVVLEKDFEETSRDFLHEGDFLVDGKHDIDWGTLYEDVTTWPWVVGAGCEVTNVSYLIVYNWDADHYESSSDTNTQVKANATLVTRRFERTRTVPTPVQQESTVTVFNKSRPTFSWKIEGEDKWASWFGTTYTAFKVRVRDLSGNLVYDSDIRRLPAMDSYGKYSWTAPLYVGEVVPETGRLFSNLTDYTWEVAVYNAKFSTDDLISVTDNKVNTGNPFSALRTFRMNVTDMDASSRALAVRVCYAGPATLLANKVRVQAFESPDFTGDPVAEITLGDVSAAALSPSAKTANAKLIGLPTGKYFLRAYIDTNGNGVHDAWESFGYLNERDQASKTGIFNPVAAEAVFNPSEDNVRLILIEDCDTDGDWFPDVWEAEQNSGEFDPEVIKPVTGNAELLGVNPELDTNLLTKAMQGFGGMMSALKSANGVALMTGIRPADVEMTAGGLEVKSEIDPDTLTIVGFAVDAAQNRVLLKVGAETTANVDSAVANFLNITVRKGAEVTVRVEQAKSPNGPWEIVPGVDGKVTVDRAGADIVVELDGELPAQGYFRARIEE